MASVKTLVKILLLHQRFFNNLTDNLSQGPEDFDIRYLPGADQVRSRRQLL